MEIGEYVCIQNAQLSPSVLWEAAWLCTHMRSWRIPTCVGSAHCFICDPKSFLRESVDLCFVIVSFASEIQQLMYRSLCPVFHCQEKLESIVSCRRWLSWQSAVIQWKLSNGVWVILLRSPKGSRRLCNTCRFPEWVIGYCLFLVVPPLKSFTVPYPTRFRHEVRAKDSTCLFPAVLLGCCCPACTGQAAVGFIREWWPNWSR